MDGDGRPIAKPFIAKQTKALSQRASSQQCILEAKVEEARKRASPDKREGSEHAIYTLNNSDNLQG
jgi:hypothetical protein